MIPKRPKQEDNVDSWLMSYADMITLLLCFFIIFVSVSEPKKDKITQIAEGMSGKFGAVNYQAPFLGAVRALQSTIESEKLYKDVVVASTNSSLSMEISIAKFFADGGAEIDKASLPMLNELVEALKKSDIKNFDIAIESHTDDTPPKSGLYKTNFELSSLRAAKLADYFILLGFPKERTRAVGYGDTRPKVPNLDKNGHPILENRAKNQRVTITLLAPQ